MRGSIVIDGQRFHLSIDDADMIEVSTGSQYVTVPNLPDSYHFRDTLRLQDDKTWQWNNGRVYTRANRTAQPEAASAVHELAERAVWTWVGKKDALRTVVAEQAAVARERLHAYQQQHDQASAQLTDAERELWERSLALDERLAQLREQRTALETEYRQTAVQQRNLQIHVRNAWTQQQAVREIDAVQQRLRWYEEIAGDISAYTGQAQQRPVPAVEIADAVRLPGSGVGLDDI